MPSPAAVRYSFVVPVHNEAPVLPKLRGRLCELMDQLDAPSEVILVDDGSTDTSLQLATRIAADDGRFRVIELSRNFGHQTAITAGIDFTSGAAVIILDADLQDPPEVVPQMIDLWRQGSDVVYGRRDDRSSDTTFKRGTARLYYKVLDRLTDIDVPLDVGDFRLLDRKVVDALGHLREDDRYLRGMIAWLGYRQAEVRYARAPREAGETKYTLRKMARLAIDGVVGFSNRPLHLAADLGFVIAALALAAAVFTMAQRLFGADLVPGWASVVMAVAFLGGIQLVVLGVIGTYLGRVYGEVKRRPLYVVASVHGGDLDAIVPSRAVVPPKPAPRASHDPLDASRT